MTSVLGRVAPVPPLEPVQDGSGEIQSSKTAAILSRRRVRVVAIRARPAVVQVRNVVALDDIVEAVARVRSNIVTIVVVVDGRVVALLATIAARPPAEPVLDVGGFATVALLGGRAFVGDDGVFAAVGFEDGVGFLALVDVFVAVGVVAVERGGGHGEGREGVSNIRAGQHVDEAAAVGLAAGVDAVLVDAVGLVEMFQEVADELQVVGGGQGVAGGFPDIS